MMIGRSSAWRLGLLCLCLLGHSSWCTAVVGGDEDGGFSCPERLKRFRAAVGWNRTALACASSQLLPSLRNSIELASGYRTGGVGAQCLAGVVDGVGEKRRTLVRDECRGVDGFLLVDVGNATVAREPPNKVSPLWISHLENGSRALFDGYARAIAGYSSVVFVVLSPEAFLVTSFMEMRMSDSDLASTAASWDPSTFDWNAWMRSSLRGWNDITRYYLGGRCVHSERNCFDGMVFPVLYEEFAHNLSATLDRTILQLTGSRSAHLACSVMKTGNRLHTPNPSRLFALFQRDQSSASMLASSNRYYDRLRRRRQPNGAVEWSGE